MSGGKESLLEALDAVEERYDLRLAQIEMLENVRERLAEDRNVIVLAGRPGSGKTWLLRRIVREYRDRVFYSVPSRDLAEREYERFDEWELSVDLWRKVEDYGDCRVDLQELLGDELELEELLEVMRCAGSAQEEPKSYPWFYRKDGPLLGSIEDEELREKVRRALYEGNPFVKGFAPWDACEDCEIVRQLREPARIVCLSFQKLLSAPFLYSSHRRAREALGKEPFVTEENWKEALKDSLVVLDDAHVLPATLVVEVRGYVKVGPRSLERELRDLALDQSHMWQVVDWNRNVRKVRKALEDWSVFHRVYELLSYELEDWIEELRDRVERERRADYLDAKKKLILLNELINRSEEAGVEEWVVVKSPRRGRGQSILTFAPVVSDLKQLLTLLMGPEYLELPAAYLAAENRPTLSELDRRGARD